MRKLFVAFGMSFAKVGHTICRSDCFVGQAFRLFVVVQKSLSVRISCHSFRPTRNFVYIQGVAKRGAPESLLTPARQIVRPGKAHAKSKVGLTYEQGIYSFWHELCGSLSRNMQVQLAWFSKPSAVCFAKPAISRLFCWASHWPFDLLSQPLTV